MLCALGLLFSIELVGFYDKFLVYYDAHSPSSLVFDISLEASAPLRLNWMENECTPFPTMFLFSILTINKTNFFDRSSVKKRCIFYHGVRYDMKEFVLTFVTITSLHI